jgi:hypothetical protein
MTNLEMESYNIFMNLEKREERKFEICGRGLRQRDQ